MKSIKYIAILTLVPLLITGCADSVASLGGGDDVKKIVAKRGDPSAQVTKQEVDQYQRQQQLVEEEMRLEQDKQQNATNSLNGYVGEAGQLFNFVKGFARN